MNEERILKIISDRIIDIQLAADDPYEVVEARIWRIKRETLEDLLDEIAMKSGLTAADVRVPVGPRA